MKKSLLNSSKQLAAAAIVFVVRLGQFLPNVSPLGSWGFFGQYPGLFVLSIVLFDLVKGGFYRGFLFTYAGFICYALLGKIAHGAPKKQLFFLPFASVCFFLISNFGVWLYWYPQTWAGLAECYLLAIPFYSRTLVGDLLFGYSYMALTNRSQITSFLQKSHQAIT
jgi:hypothetical protein